MIARTTNPPKKRQSAIDPVMSANEMVRRSMHPRGRVHQGGSI